MVDNSWVLQAQIDTYSRIKGVANTLLATDYPDINFTTVQIDPSTAKFPTAYVHFIDNMVNLDGMEQQYIDKFIMTVQIEIFANDVNKTDSIKIGTVINNIMNSMEFIGVPITEYYNNYTRTFARYRKEVFADSLF